MVAEVEVMVLEKAMAKVGTELVEAGAGGPDLVAALGSFRIEVTSTRHSAAPELVVE